MEDAVLRRLKGEETLSDAENEEVDEVEMSEASDNDNDDHDDKDNDDDSYWYGYDCNIRFSDDEEY